MKLYIFVLRDHKMWRLYNFLLYKNLVFLPQNLGFLTPKITVADPFPTGPQK